jgi:hypothetical protein
LLREPEWRTYADRQAENNRRETLFHRPSPHASTDSERPERVDACHRNYTIRSSPDWPGSPAVPIRSIESLMLSAVELGRALAQAWLVDREALAAAQGACDPIGAYRASGHRKQKAEERPARAASRSGIV